MNNINISEAFEKYLISSRIHADNPDKVRKFYVSDMGKCMRMRFLKRKGIGTQFDNFVYWTFQLGDLIHEFGYKALEAQGLLISTEEFVDINEHFTGRYDGKIKYKKPTIFDFKSANPWKIKKLEEGGEDGAEDAMQVLVYVMYELKKDPALSEDGVVLYINKEPSEKVTKTLTVARTYHLSLWEKKIKADMDKMIEYWENDIIPPCTCPGWMKPYNSYLPFCQMSETEIRKNLTLIKKGKKIISTKSEIIVGEYKTEE